MTPRLDMIARVGHFNLRELLEWTALFIRVHLRDPEPELVEGSRDEFAGSNSMVREIERIEQAQATKSRKETE